MSRSTSSVVTLAICVAGGLLALPSSAFALRTPERLERSAPLGTVVPARLIDADAPRRDRARAAATPGETTAYAAPDGQLVDVTFSPGYAVDPQVAQDYVNFLGSMPHGSELSKLNMYIAPPAEVRSRCGGRDGTLACYATSNSTMTVPGEQADSVAGITTSYILAHEYGHHIAARRTNSPFEALDYGPKRWASLELVCKRALDGKLFPGNEGGQYLRNPGEAWAETYARLTFPDVGWRFASLLEPDSAALAAARADVLTPWTKHRSRTFRGRFTAGGPSTRTFRFELRLDGRLTIQLAGPRGTEYDLAMASGGEVEDRTRTRGSRDRISYPDGACRERQRETITITVTRRLGGGPFTVDATYAG